jgi:DNA-binding NarL/FixJ family response regulator
MTIKISDVFPKLTKRQREVCALLMIGYSNKRVGQVLGISSRTIEDHRREILKGAEAVSLTEVAMKLCGSPEVVA